MTNEELVDLQDKVQQAHSNLFKVMLHVNELPEALLVRYFAIKKSLDRVDGILTPYALLCIAMDVGFNPATGKFEKEKHILATNDAGEVEKVLHISRPVEDGPVEVNGMAEATIGPMESEIQATDDTGESILEEDKTQAVLDDAGIDAKVSVSENITTVETDDILGAAVELMKQDNHPEGDKVDPDVAKAMEEHEAEVAAQEAEPEPEPEEADATVVEAGTSVEFYDDDGALLKGTVNSHKEGSDGIEYSIEEAEGTVHDGISEDNIEVI